MDSTCALPRSLRRPRALLFGAGWLAVFFASTAAQAANQARTALADTSSSAVVSIDGAACGPVASWEGGDLFATVVTAKLSGSPLAKKQIGSRQYSPLLLEFAFPLPGPVVSWINDFCAGKFSRRAVVMTPYDLNRQALPSTEWRNCLLTEVRFPAFVSSAKDILKLTLVLAPEFAGASSVVVPAPGPGGANARGISSDSFAFTISGPEGSSVQKIDAFTIGTAAAAAQTVGDTRENMLATAAPESGNLVLSVADDRAAGWKAWFQDFVVKGNSGDAMEKDGAITLPGGNGPNSADALSLQFSHLGIVRLARISVSAGAPARDRVELYYEGLTLAAANTVTAPAVQPGGSSPNPSSGGAAAPDAGAGTQKPVSKIALFSGPNSADLGPRDPIDVPRPAGTTRRSFSAQSNKTLADETATYASPDQLDDVADFYTEKLQAAGWEEDDRSETTNAASGRLLTITFHKAQKTAEIRLDRGKDGSGTEISVFVRTKKPGGG